MRRCIPLIFLYAVGTFGQLEDANKGKNEFTETSDPDFEIAKQIEKFEEGVVAKMRPAIQPRMRELFNEMRTLNEGEVQARFESKFEPEERVEVENIMASAISHELEDLIASVKAQAEGLNPGPLDVISEGLKRLQAQLGKIFRLPHDHLGPQGLTDGWVDNSLGQPETNSSGNPPVKEPFKLEPVGEATGTASPQEEQNPVEDKTEDEDEEANEEEGEEVEGEGEEEESDEDNAEDDGEEEGEFYDDEGEDESDEDEGGQAEDDGENYEEDDEGEEDDEDEEDRGRNRRGRRSQNERDEL